MRIPADVGTGKLCCAPLAHGTPVYCAAPDSAEPAWRWVEKPDESIALHGPNGVVWQLNLRSMPKPFFDPLSTPDGRNLVWNQPDDHVWHHGLWFSWKLINGVNYWEHTGRNGKPAGATALRDIKVARRDQQGATIVMQLAYHPADQPDAVVMTETVTLEIETPRDDGSYAIDWSIDLTATTDVTLDRTPPPGQPGGKGWGGYGGLSYRGAKALKDVTITDSEGRQGEATHRQRARWVDATGTIDGKPAGVAMFDHPANPRHPTPWFTLNNQLRHGPFIYTNPALLCFEPLKLAKGETLQLRYRVLVHSGALTAEQLNERFAAWAESSPPATVHEKE